MKKRLRTAAIFVALSLFTTAAAICSAQMTGNYREATKTDKEIVSAAKFAVEAQNKSQKGSPLKLISIERAEKQVVAGINYRLCLAVKTKNTDEQAMAVVYQNLQNQYQLTSWTSGSCGEDDSGDNELETVTYMGKLEVGKSDSTILYVGEESGDYAAFCFMNKSKAGRAILARCKNGKQCEFTGKVDFEKSCKVKNLEASLSASGTILSIESVKSLGGKK